MTYQYKNTGKITDFETLTLASPKIQVKCLIIFQELVVKWYCLYLVENSVPSSAVICFQIDLTSSFLRCYGLDVTEICALLFKMLDCTKNNGKKFPKLHEASFIVSDQLGTSGCARNWFEHTI